MSYKHADIAKVASALKARLKTADEPRQVLRAPELKQLFGNLGKLESKQRASYGQELNQLKAELEELAVAGAAKTDARLPIDVTAPFDVNVTTPPQLLSSNYGSRHPLMTELDKVIDIFARMGFVHMDSRQIDDEHHMFDSLNFPEGHPARDDYDTFTTKEGLIAPAHVSVMQNRLQKQYRSNLDQGQPIAVVYTGRTFRKEDTDARHEHTFYQVEISYIDKNVNVGNLIATFKTFLEEYYEQKLEVKTQPFYFPFTEPSFEMALSCPFCQKRGCNVCSQSGWIELLGCGLINPNVLEMGGIDPTQYSGFAGGLGLDRLVMMKYGIEDVRRFESGNLEFLRQFS